MTEKGHEGDQSSSSWDMPGPSLSAILDTAFTSTSSENQTNNGKTDTYHKK